MTSVEALITCARRYCVDNMEYWFKYSGEQSKDISSVDEYCHNNRFQLLAAILQEISEIAYKPFSSKDECLSELEVIGTCAQTDHTEHVNDEIGISAMNDEREKFITFVQNVPDEELSRALPLPYSRKLGIAESRELRKALERLWNFDGGYWNPLEDKHKGEIFFIMTQYVTQADMDKILQFLAPDKESHYYVFDELCNDDETEIIDIDLSVAETVYTNKTFDWIIYVSHEGTITFGGDHLIAFVKKLFAGRIDSERRRLF